jgi:glycosyltransferase involved in cell wall biosynthesis
MSENIMKLSIAIVTRNRGHLSVNTLSSLKRQSKVPDEILVVDNASTDNTRNLVERISINLPMKYVFCSEIGVNAARNTAIAHSTGDILAFIDDDAEAEPYWLEELFAMFQKYSDATAVVGLKENMFPGNFVATLIQFTMRNVSMARDRDGELVLSPTIVDSCNLALKRKVILDRGIFFDNTFIGGGDRHFGHQLFQFDLKVYFCETAIVRHRWPKTFRKYFRMRHWSGMITATLQGKLGTEAFSSATIQWGPLKVAQLAWETASFFPFSYRVAFLLLVAIGQIFNKVGFISTKRKIDRLKRLGKNTDQRSFLLNGY